MKKYDATVVYCTEDRQSEPLLNEPEECETIEEFIDFLYTLIAGVVLDPEADDVLHAISTHAYTADEFEEDGEVYVNVSIFVA